jgi:outer membrane protein assembly factor BamB
MRFPRLDFLLIPSLCLAANFHGFAENWPGWRGPRGDGSSQEKQVPVRWNAEAGEGLVWKTAIPGDGHSSPIVHGQRVFISTALFDTQDRVLLCLNRNSGKELWRRTVITAPLERKHRENSYASSTPSTDGERVFVTFLDGQDAVVAAYDFDGKQLWLVRPGKFKSVHGFSSSPVVFEDKVIINGDHDGDAWIAALARKDGATVWKIDRENKTRSYCTPLIRDLAGRTQMILSGSKCVASYDPRSGERHWVIDGPTEQFVASVVYNPKHDMLFVTGGYPDLHILGVKPDGRGNITDTHIAWRAKRGVSYVPSPISEGDYFIVVSDSGIATCFHAGTGEQQWQERIGPHAHSSLVAANGFIYGTTDDGTTTVIKPGPTLEVVARNTLGEPCFSSPAISDGRVFVRGAKHLFCFAEKR